MPTDHQRELFVCILKEYLPCIISSSRSAWGGYCCCPALQEQVWPEAPETVTAFGVHAADVSVGRRPASHAGAPRLNPVIDWYMCF